MRLGVHPGEGVFFTAFDNFVARNPKVMLDIYVDDIQTAAIGSKEAVVTFLTEATLAGWSSTRSSRVWSLQKQP